MILILHLLIPMMIPFWSRIPFVGASFVPIAQNSFVATNKASAFTTPFILPPRTFSLYAINATDTSSSSSWSPTSRLVPDDFNADLLMADLVGLLFASQLMGLLDVLNSNSFGQSGGWLQPVTLESGTSALSNLTGRFARNACLYVAGALAAGAFSISATNENKETSDLVKMALQKALQGTVGFLVLRVVLAIGMVLAVGQQGEFALQDTLRDTYFVALATLSTRYVVYNFYNRYY